MEAPDPERERQSAAARYAELVGVPMAPVPAEPKVQPIVPSEPPTWTQIGVLVRERVFGPATSAARPEMETRPLALAPSPSPVEIPLPAPVVRGLGDIASDVPLRDDTRGKTGFITGKLGPPKLPGIGHPEWEPLHNRAAGEPVGQVPLNDYGRRRERMIAMLNSCDRVLAVSHFVRDKFIAMGVDPAKIERQTIGTALNQAVRQSAELLFDPPAFNPSAPRPIRLVFLGFNSFYKGLHMLLDTLELMTPEYTQRLHLFVYAKDGQHQEWRFRRLEPRLGGLTMHHGYEPWDIPWIMGGKDATIVPSVWWDNAPQTVFESMACGVPVIGADLGGIPDFVRHAENGLLFRGNDRFDLARLLAELVRNPQILTELRRNVRPPKDIEDHASELETLYAGCLSSGSARAGVVGGVLPRVDEPKTSEELIRG